MGSLDTQNLLASKIMSEAGSLSKFEEGSQLFSDANTEAYQGNGEQDSLTNNSDEKEQIKLNKRE